MHVDNKQEELETIVQQENDVFAITKTWWNDSHDWSAAIEVCKLFRRDGQSSTGAGVALYIRECFDCIESDDNEDDKVEWLWVKIRAKISRPGGGSLLNHPTRMNRLMSHSTSTGRSLTISSPNTCGQLQLAKCPLEIQHSREKAIRRLLKYVKDDFPTQLVNEPTRGGALLD